MQTISDRTLTAANSVFLVRAKGFNDNFIRIEGYAADNAFDFGQGQIGETRMGVDGKQSGGFTPHEVDFNVQLESTSKSRDFFDALANHIKKKQETLVVEFSVEVPAIKKRHHATGFMVETAGGTTAKKLLEPATYSFRVIANTEEI